MGMPRARKQKYRCQGCGRRSRGNPTPNAYPEARREEILHASQEREPLAWPHAHGSLVSRATVSSWIKKKEIIFLLYGPPWFTPTPRMSLPPSWNSMNGWLVCPQKSQRLLDLDRLVPPDTSNGGLCRG